ncbi:LOW QUALITY PROTEIN: gasdermin-C-like [Eptesicus fuscus]|uniref:LOW QUALITY PROTEIN: gasdermin-C-like n=1 Tax=Eptesicus fuscus TaxID=29078 RepID=UPI002403CA9E|nr:LOW QUALITY PROTEIN: gasdermin-C-like [Eptesicus fuscus]
MPSMFERTTKKLVKDIGPQELRPVKCLERATKIRQFSLIQRKKARSRFWKLPDDPLDVSLRHILEPGSSVPDAAVKVSADFSDSMVRKQQAAGNVNAGADVGFSGEMTMCRGSSLEYQIVSTPHETWKELQERKLLDPEPAFLKQCREAGVNLYVVTDTVELLNSSMLQDLSSANVSGKFSIARNICFQGEGQGGGLKVREKKLTVPKGSVLAYKRKQLVFHNKGWGIFHITDDVVDDDDDDDDDDDTLLADFKLLEEEVSQKVKAAELSKGMRGVVFSNLLAMLGHREALQDLMDTLELELDKHLEGPGGAILTELRKDSRYPEVGSKSLLLYLLEALIVLSDIQLDLLAQSMEKRILVQQRDLVRSILEPNFNCFQNIPFTLQPELLAPLQGEGLVITYGLLDECGLKMKLNSPRSTWIPEAKEPLSALYGALSVLTQLAEA